MKNKLIIIILILLYLVSCAGSWRMVKYSYENHWKTLNPRLDDLVLVFFPVFNTFFCIYWLIYYSGVFDMNFNEFFGIEKRK